MKNKHIKSPQKSPKRTGFIQMIIIIVGALVLLKYIYSIDVVNFLTTGRFRDILDQIYKFGSVGWEKYNDLIIGVSNYIIDFIKNILTKFR